MASDGSKTDGFYGYNAHTDVETVTDSAGDTRSTYSYTAYGSDDITGFTGIDKPDPAVPDKPADNVYRYNAKRWDQVTGSYDMGFRDYNPGLNQFLTRDTYNGALADLNLGSDPYTGNRYAFAGGNPVTGIELDGHLTGAACGPDGIRCGMTDMASSSDYTPLPAPAPAAEPEPHGNYLQRVVHNTADFASGAWDGGVETVKGAGQLGYDVFWGSSPFADEQTRAETRARAQARKYAVTHPKELAEAIIAPYQQDLAAGRDGHAAGRAVFDGATVLLAGGSLTKVGKAATTAERAVAMSADEEAAATTRVLSTSEQRSLRSLQSQVASHRLKLEAYRADPYAFDNQRLLARAPTPEIRQRIIDGRIRHLEHEIATFQDQIAKLLGGS